MSNGGLSVMIVVLAVVVGVYGPRPGQSPAGLPTGCPTGMTRLVPIPGTLSGQGGVFIESRHCVAFSQPSTRTIQGAVWSRRQPPMAARVRWMDGLHHPTLWGVRRDAATQGFVVTRFVWSRETHVYQSESPVTYYGLADGQFADLNQARASAHRAESYGEPTEAVRIRALLDGTRGL